jgi:hypothetical protein
MDEEVRRLVLMVSAAVLWSSSLHYEYWLAVQAGTYAVKGQWLPPCSIQRQHSGYNYVCVGLPIAIMLYEQMLFVTQPAMDGAWGFTVLIETAAMLAVMGFQEIRRWHNVALATVFISSCLTWLNIAPRYLYAIALPQVSLWLLQLGHDIAWGCVGITTVRSIIIWCMDMYFIASHLFLIGAHPEPWTHHRHFDMAAGAALVLTLAVVWGLQRAFPEWRLMMIVIT